MGNCAQVEHHVYNNGFELILWFNVISNIFNVFNMTPNVAPTDNEFWLCPVKYLPKQM